MRLPALEKNILVYRAVPMAQFLFYAESVRKQLVCSVGPSIPLNRGRELKGAKLLKGIFKRLEEERSISRAESIALQALLQHRNRIAHDIHLLTGDIEIPGKTYHCGTFVQLQYDYAALESIKKWHKVLWSRLSKKYILTISFDSLLFETAEQAYGRELLTLRKRIDRQFLARKKKLSNRKA
jgi:hypothetical protein